MNSASSDETGNDGENETTVAQNQKNPLELTPVIECVLQYMNVADLKKCRYVSKEWSSSGLLQLKNRSRIVFRRGDWDEGRHADRTPARFFEKFPNTSILFTAFKLKGDWKITELNSLLLHKNILHELRIQSVKLFDAKKKIIESFDITPFISDSPMTMPNTKFNTELSVDQLHITTKIVVSISSLIHVKKLQLINCQIILDDKIRSSPVELELSRINFVKNGEKVTNICINDVFDFSRSKTIKIRPSSYMYDMEFDLSSPSALTLDCLELEDVNVTNWNSCRWSVKRLKLYEIPFLENTEMQIKDFYFNGSSIDLSLLPRSIGSLKVTVHEENSCFSSQGVNLPNLKSLYLNVKAHLSELMFHFVNYPLVELDLSGQNTTQEINFDSIPKSVKKLRLKDLKVNIQKGDSPLSLDRLGLENYSYQDNTLGVLTSSHFKTTELVIVGYHAEIKVNAHNLLSFLLSDKACLDCHQRFYIGPFYWSDQSFKSSPLKQYLNGKAEYYVFENRKGKTVNDEELKELETACL